MSDVTKKLDHKPESLSQAQSLTVKTLVNAVSAVIPTEKARLTIIEANLFFDFGTKGRIQQDDIKHLEGDPCAARHVLARFNPRLSNNTKKLLQSYIIDTPSSHTTQNNKVDETESPQAETVEETKNPKTEETQKVESPKERVMRAIANQQLINQRK